MPATPSSRMAMSSSRLPSTARIFPIRPCILLSPPAASLTGKKQANALAPSTPMNSRRCMRRSLHRAIVNHQKHVPDVEIRAAGSSYLQAAGHPANRKPGKEEDTMRSMFIGKAAQDSEVGVMPSEELLAVIIKYNVDWVVGGVMVAREGLHPSSLRARVRLAVSKRTVIDGPFTEREELVAAF